jgi:hypothetical protein
MDLNHRPLPYQGETADSTTCRKQKSTWSEHCASLRNPLVEASPRGRCYTTATRILHELAEFYVNDSYGSLVPLSSVAVRNTSGTRSPGSTGGERETPQPVAAEGDRLLDPMISVLPLKGVQIASWKRRNPWTSSGRGVIRQRSVGLAFEGLGHRQLRNRSSCPRRSPRGSESLSCRPPRSGIGVRGPNG